MRHQTVNFLQTHPLLDRPLHPDQTNTVLIFEQFTNSTDPTITEMINIVDAPFTVTQINQVTDNFKDIFFGQRCMVKLRVEPELEIELQTTNC